jgi:hypothetical protein
VCRDALEAVGPQLQRLAQLEDDRSTQQQQQQQQQRQRQQQQPERQALAQDSKECLLAIGAHIEGGRLPAWMEDLVDASDLWPFVSKATGHRMGGEQLARLYAAMLQQGQLQRPDEGVDTPPATAAAGVRPPLLASRLLPVLWICGCEWTAQCGDARRG